MSDESQAGSGAPVNANSGAEGNPVTIRKEDHERALKDLHRFKSQASEVQKERDDLKARLEALENSKKQNDGDFKSLYEQQKTVADEWKGKHENLKSSMILTQKHQAASSALMKAGLKPEFSDFLERETFEEMAVEVTSNGRFLVEGAELIVDKWKKKYPGAFQQAQAPTVNTGGGSAGTPSEPELTMEYMNSIEKTDPVKYHKLFPTFFEQWKKKNQKRMTS